MVNHGEIVCHWGVSKQNAFDANFLRLFVLPCYYGGLQTLGTTPSEELLVWLFAVSSKPANVRQPIALGSLGSAHESQNKA